MRSATLNNLGGFYRYVGVTSLAYAAVTALTFLIKKDVSLVDVVTIGKIFSLFTIVLVNGDVPRAIDKEQNDIKMINYFILIVSTIILIMSCVKFLGLDFAESTTTPIVKNFLTIIYKHIFWISVFPLVAYAFLDYYIAFVRKSNIEEKQIALKFFVFVDLVCVLPLALVYLLGIIYAEFISGVKVSAEIFTSGSMAIALLSSAIATKAVEEFFEHQQSPRSSE